MPELLPHCTNACSDRDDGRHLVAPSLATDPFSLSRTCRRALSAAFSLTTAACAPLLLLLLPARFCADPTAAVVPAAAAAAWVSPPAPPNNTSACRGDTLALSAAPCCGELAGGEAAAEEDAVDEVGDSMPSRPSASATRSWCESEWWWCVGSIVNTLLAMVLSCSLRPWRALTCCV